MKKKKKKSSPTSARAVDTAGIQLLNGDCLQVLKTIPDNSIGSLVTDPPAGISFMGKDWDSDKGSRDQWIKWLSGVMRECYRVLKPGAHGLVWALPRTSHWTAMSCEYAGFEVRDVVVHLFGSGFPKSMDVAKAIDKASGHWRGRAGQITIAEQLSKGTEYERTEKGQPVVPAASMWNGWGTALKPASEHWILIQKPISEPTIELNVLKWGVGAINIDGCRIPGVKPQMIRHSKNNSLFDLGSASIDGTTAEGRFPSNVVLDEKAARLLDDQSGISRSTKLNTVQKTRNDPSQLKGVERERVRVDEGYSDSDGASRFFYCAKAAKSEKNIGCDDLPAKACPNSLSGGTEKRLDGRSVGENKNFHPTVKPKSLMSYLCKLITPPEEWILDPFMGSGTTGVVAREGGFSFVGIEKDSEYFKIASARINCRSRENRDS